MQTVVFCRKILFLINILPHLYSFIKRTQVPHSRFFFFNRAWPQTQKRKNKHILVQQRSCYAWSFIETNPIRKRSCVEHSRLGLKTPAINIWAEFTVQQQYKWCWTPLWNMPSLTQARQTENLRKDLCAASKITHEMTGALTVWGGLLKQ